MKSNTAIALTLAGILGLTGSVNFMQHGISKQQGYREIVPARVQERIQEINNELMTVEHKYNNRTFHYIATAPEFQEAVNKYRKLTKEKDSYLENPKIAKAIKNYDKGTCIRVGSGALGACSGFLTLIGGLGLFAKYWKKE